MLRLVTFGGLALESLDTVPAPRLRSQPLAILAVVASAGTRGISRERLCAMFWPDAAPEHARHSLRQALYGIRQELGVDVIESDAVLTIDGQRLSTDIGEFRAALAADDRHQVAALARGPFLHDFSVPSYPGFERWADGERSAVAAEVTRVVLQLAKEAQAASDFDAAADWWRRLTLHDPLSGRFALGYLKALAANGDRAGALAFARAHENLVRRELEADPDPEIRRLESELRAIPSPIVARHAPLAAPRAPLSPPPLEAAAEAPVPVRSSRRRALVIAAATFVVVAGAAALTAGRLKTALGFGAPHPPTFAVGLIRDEGLADTLRLRGVVTEMLATNLARVAGLSVLANSRLFELMPPGQDTLASSYSAAARLAGATEILQGRLVVERDSSLALELQRVDLATGLVKNGYRAAARDGYALIDSVTALIVRDLRLSSPGGSIADATTRSPVAYRLYEEGLRAYYQFDVVAARRLMEAALREDANFPMAAYYYAIMSLGEPIVAEAATRALRLAKRAPQRERLLITSHISNELNDPASRFYAESLASSYANDPRAVERLAQSQVARGEWAASVSTIERVIAMDSASEPVGRQDCRLCANLTLLSQVYQWWDSLPASDRTAMRLLRLRNGNNKAWDIVLRSAAARGDTAAMRSYFNRFRASSHSDAYAVLYLPRYIVLAEQYDEALRDIAPFVDSPRPGERDEARWLQIIALRNLGRLDEALRWARQPPTLNTVAEAVVSMELENVRAATRMFTEIERGKDWNAVESVQARSRAWRKTLLAMALLAANDTTPVRGLADSIEYWGQRSNYGRDRQLHHYVRGMLLVAQRRDADAAAELREALFSPSHGFTLANYELGRALLRLNRPAEAVPVVSAALHGDLDGSNFYVTRTVLHEVLAQAFDRLGQRDSAAVHYRAVASAWRNADPIFHARRDSARAWLAAHVVSR